MKKLIAPLLGATLLGGCVVVVGDVDDRPVEHFSRQLNLPADGLQHLNIITGAGELRVIGVEGLEEIQVDAEVWAHSRNESDYALTLEGFGRNAELVAKSNRRSGFQINIGGSGRIDVTVRMPRRLALDIDDGSGDISVRGIKGKVVIEDGSGGIGIADLGGDLVIDDNSGEIVVDNVRGNVEIEDGSGDIIVSNVGKTLSIDDGSGDIEVTNIHDLRIEESGSGDVIVNDAG